MLLACLALGGAFELRSYTVHHLPLWSDGPVTALAILPEDLHKLDHRMAAVLDLPGIKKRLEGQPGPFLVYLMPEDYIMQGMIADTGGTWKLYKQHHTLSMIGDWIFHPFRHLECGHAAMGEGMKAMEGHVGMGGVVKRMIFLRVEATKAQPTPSDLFAINAHRTPLFFADVDIHNLTVKEIQDLPSETGWGRVPTPMF